MDSEKVIHGLECCCEHIEGMNCDHCPYDEEQIEIGQINQCTSVLAYDALALLKEQEDEKKRIMKVIWDTLHEGLSIDTVADQDWVYERIRHRIEDA